MTVHVERRSLPYTPTQLFDLVADVERYPEFVPGVREVRARRRDPNTIIAEMTIGVGPLRRRFTSSGALDPPRRIQITSDDPIFRRFRQAWTFTPSLNCGAEVEFCADIEFRSPLLAAMAAPLVSGAAPGMIRAFARRAEERYGSSL
jgi:coenzyme Q-binding protein COQ10